MERQPLPSILLGRVRLKSSFEKLVPSGTMGKKKSKRQSSQLDAANGESLFKDEFSFRDSGVIGGDDVDEAMDRQKEQDDRGDFDEERQLLGTKDDPLASATKTNGDASGELPLVKAYSSICSDDDDDNIKGGASADGLKKGDSDDDSEDDDEGVNKTYPADCYSFIALHTPWSNPGFFMFGFMVWAFQIAFLILMVMRVVSRKHSTNEDVGNPEDGILADFIPANVPPLARATQYFAILSYCIFSDSSVKDIVVAVETFPRFEKVKRKDKVASLILSSVLRLAQGLLSCVAVVFLVVNTADVIDIVLNFTAVGFISDFDDIAFELAQWGKYGPTLKREANRIEELPAPDCIRLKYQHVRYRWTVIPIAIALLSFVSIVAIWQQSTKKWHTPVLRVQFDSEETTLGGFSGCFDLRKEKDPGSGGRSTYSSNLLNEEGAMFSYCKQKRKWFLYEGNESEACSISTDNILAYSAKTYEYDIYASFEETWYSKTGTPLEMYFFIDETLDEEMCSAFLGDGKCNPYFNQRSYAFDNGDCCASSCEGPLCGVGTLNQAFNTSVSTGNGFQNCDDPDQTAISIRINDVYVPEKEGLGGAPESMFADLEPRQPLMILECDGKIALMVNVQPAMINQTEVVKVADGADCVMKIKNVTSGDRDIYSVDYSIYHGNENEMELNPIVILNADSHLIGIKRFHRIEECIIGQLSDNLKDTSTIYTGTAPQNKAIEWLMKDPFSSCEDEFFVERYALAAINYAIPSVYLNDTTEEFVTTDEFWINESRQCTWSNVACTDGSITELDLGSSGLGYQSLGVIPTEIGLLSNLVKLDMSYNYLISSIPTELGLWTSLNYFSVESNLLTGSIPDELATMTNLNWFFGAQNSLNGTIPDLSEMSNMTGFIVWSNALTGTIPTNLGDLSSMEYFILSDNPITGTIPSSLGSMENITYLGLRFMDLTGTIPSALGNFDGIETLELNHNDLTGNVPQSVVDESVSGSLTNLNVFGNRLSNLLPADGQEICEYTNSTTGNSGEHYCNCAEDCLKDLKDGVGNRCQCDPARSCCEDYFVYANITNCVVCEEELTNPGLVVPDWGFIPCGFAPGYVYGKLDEFGTQEQCDGAKWEIYRQGCVCPGYIPPGEKLAAAAAAEAAAAEEAGEEIDDTLPPVPVSQSEAGRKLSKMFRYMD